MSQVSFEATKEEHSLILKIAKRASEICAKHGVAFDILDTQMDLAATHANGCPLDLARLLEADDFNLMHDVGGIYRHLNRDTGKLENHFLPRFALREEAHADS